MKTYKVNVVTLAEENDRFTGITEVSVLGSHLFLYVSVTNPEKDLVRIQAVYAPGQWKAVYVNEDVDNQE